jgi:hypothetical protein
LSLLVNLVISKVRVLAKGRRARQIEYCHTPREDITIHIKQHGGPDQPLKVNTASKHELLIALCRSNWISDRLRVRATYCARSIWLRPSSPSPYPVLS